MCVCVCFLLPSMTLALSSSCFQTLVLGADLPHCSTSQESVCVGVCTYMCECVSVCDWCSVAQQVSPQGDREALYCENTLAHTRFGGGEEHEEEVRRDGFFI